jgi:MFS superfamily sulfate permease-like transporter
MTTIERRPPRGDLAGLVACWRRDLLSGFLVFLIALPLCLGIALASGYPAIAGVFTAIVGGLITPWISNSELTIKGPAAGLIVIALGAITECVEIYGLEQGYRMVLGIGVAAGVLQVVFGLTRSGILGEFFPSSVVHGMLAAIGVIIVSKQIHITLGVNDVGGEPLELLAEIPRSITRLNPEIALIGLLSLVILFGLPLIRNRWIGRIPGPMLVLLVTVPIGMAFDLTHDHFYTLAGHRYHLGEEYLVAIPGNLFAAITTPRFDALAGWAGWKWVILFALVGSVESLLSAKAVEMIDPDRRKTDLNRDLLAIGVGNVASAAIGGLPMISEIVRSKANADSGAQTRFANLYHGLFLLGFVALLPGLIHQIPLAALSAMLVYTGARLASPREFQNVFRIGKEQLVIFLVTMVGVLATDLLVGVAFGIAVKLSIHVLNGVPLRSLFKPYLRIEQRGDGTSVIVAKDSAVFSNWIPFKHQIEQIGLNQRNNLVVDLSETKLIDHSVMEKLHELQEEFGREGLSLELAGLESHRKLSGHDFSARRGGLTRIRRLTLVCPTGVTDEILAELARCGASGYTITDCRGSGRSTVLDGSGARNGMVRIEVLIAPEKVDGVEALIRKRLRSGLPMTASFETVSVVRPDHF